MITSEDINLWAEIKLLDLLRKTGIDQAKIASLQGIFYAIMNKNKIRGNKRHAERPILSTLDILMVELEMEDIPTLLTGALYEVFEQDIITALAIANLFGNDICFTVDILTTQKARHLSDREFFQTVVSRFNKAKFDKEKRLMTIVVIQMLVKRIHLLLTSESISENEQRALYSSTVNSFLPEFSSKLDVSKVDVDLAVHYFKAQTLLVSVVFQTGQGLTHANDLTSNQNTMAPRLAISSMPQ